MKKKTLVILAAIFLISSFSACGDKAKNTDDNHSLINYTDTGDVSSSINSRTADIEHSTVSSESASVSNESSDKATVSSRSTIPESSKSSGSSSNKNTESTVSNTVNTITYYFENEVDSESSTSLTSSDEQDSEIHSDTDTNSESSADTDTDTDTVSSQTASEEPVAVGSYTEEDIAFYYNGEKIYMGDSIEPVIDIVGEPEAIENGVYYYDGFSITVTESEDVSETRVDAVQFFSKDLSTEKGISVGMTYDDIVKTYGDNITVKDGQQRYYYDNKYMYFDIPNEVIANIGYGIDHEVEFDSETE